MLGRPAPGRRSRRLIPCASPPLSQAGAMCKFEENLGFSRLQLSQAGTLFRQNSPKRGRRARWGRISASDGRISPRPGLCGGAAAHRPGFGERGGFRSGKPGFFCATSRLGREAPPSGAWQPGKTAGQKLAILSCSPKPGPCSSKTLPSKDVTQGSGAFLPFSSLNPPKPGTCSIKILPSKDVVQDEGELLPPTVVFLPSRDLVPAELSQAGTLCKPLE